MAERRMFHSAVVESDAFLDMPVGAQALYFHLGMHADDDGFINGPRQIARKLRRPPRELKLLVDAGFLLDFDGIVVIRHWLVGNCLKADRMKALNYPDIAEKIYVAANRVYTLESVESTDNLWKRRTQRLESKRNPKVREGKVREGKVTEEKVREEKIREDKTAVAVVPGGVAPGAAAATDREKQLEFFQGKLGKGVVLLSQQQVEDLLDKLGLDSFDYYVERMADFILSKQAKVKNHYATILKWWEEDRSVCQ